MLELMLPTPSPNQPLAIYIPQLGIDYTKVSLKHHIKAMRKYKESGS